MRRSQIIVDVSVAGLFTVVAMVLELESGRTGSFNALGSTLVPILMGGALAVRRLSPAGALALAWVGAVTQMTLQRQPSFVDIAIFAVLYATAAYGTRRVFWLGFASCIAGAIVITLYLFTPLLVGLPGTPLWSERPSWTELSAALAVLLAALFGLLLSWTVGALVRTGIRARENRIAQEAAEAETVVEAERTRLARDMHDIVAHSLAVVIAQADGARYAADPEKATAALGTISSTARSALTDVRMLLTQLRHSQGDGPQPTLADLEQLYAQVRAAGVDLRVDVDPAPVGSPPASVQLAIYRILQEALTNALRHGTGGTVDVGLAWHADQVELTVRNGTRPDAGAGPGHGVIGMRERAQLVGGTLRAEREGDVFTVRARIPARNELS